MFIELTRWELAGFLFTVLFGSLLHFVYNWTGKNSLVGVFAPVNESTWEHLKLLFVPILFFSIVEYFAVGKNFPNYITAKSFGVVLGMLVIVIAFYTYTGIIGEHFLWADILTFLFGAAVAYAYSWSKITGDRFSEKTQFLGLSLLAVFIAFFVLFTFYPPHIGLFLDPVTNKYGVPDKERPVPRKR
ncbi:MAG TPA: DUF6512 family protein [Caproiciproducens sp.]|nr:DUF6512 family protein [Caproiciproducens sp.]